MMINGAPVTICFVISQNQNKTFKQKSSDQKSSDYFNVGRSQQWHVNVAVNVAYVGNIAYWWHMTRFGPNTCRYFATRYNNTACYLWLVAVTGPHHDTAAASLLANWSPLIIVYYTKTVPHIILFKMLLHLFIWTKWHTIEIDSLFCT